MNIKRILTIVICFLVFGFILGTCLNSCEATGYTIGWDMDPNIIASEDIVGYRLFERNEGSTYDYTTPRAEVNDPNIKEVTIENVPEGERRYWVVRAFDQWGLESGDSNEVSDHVGPPSGVGKTVEIKECDGKVIIINNVITTP